MILGTLGTLTWYRCRHCGHTFEGDTHCPTCGAVEETQAEEEWMECDECEEGLVTDIHNDPVRFCDCPLGVSRREEYENSGEEEA